MPGDELGIFSNLGQQYCTLGREGALWGSPISNGVWAALHRTVPPLVYILPTQPSAIS